MFAVFESTYQGEYRPGLRIFKGVFYDLSEFTLGEVWLVRNSVTFYGNCYGTMVIVIPVEVGQLLNIEV